MASALPIKTPPMSQSEYCNKKYTLLKRIIELDRVKDREALEKLVAEYVHFYESATYEGRPRQLLFKMPLPQGPSVFDVVLKMVPLEARCVEMARAGDVEGAKKLIDEQITPSARFSQMVVRFTPTEVERRAPAWPHCHDPAALHMLPCKSCDEMDSLLARLSLLNQIKDREQIHQIVRAIVHRANMDNVVIAGKQYYYTFKTPYPISDTLVKMAPIYTRMKELDEDKDSTEFGTLFKELVRILGPVVERVVKKEFVTVGLPKNEKTLTMTWPFSGASQWDHFAKRKALLERIVKLNRVWDWKEIEVLVTEYVKIIELFVYKDDYGRHFRVVFQTPPPEGPSVFAVVLRLAPIELRLRELERTGYGHKKEYGKLMDEYVRIMSSLVKTVQLGTPTSEQAGFDKASEARSLRNAPPTLLTKTSHTKVSPTSITAGVDAKSALTQECPIEIGNLPTSIVHVLYNQWTLEYCRAKHDFVTGKEESPIKKKWRESLSSWLNEIKMNHSIKVCLDKETYQECWKLMCEISEFERNRAEKEKEKTRPPAPPTLSTKRPQMPTAEPSPVSENLENKNLENEKLAKQLRLKDSEIRYLQRTLEKRNAEIKDLKEERIAKLQKALDQKTFELEESQKSSETHISKRKMLEEENRILKRQKVSELEEKDLEILNLRKQLEEFRTRLENCEVEKDKSEQPSKDEQSPKDEQSDDSFEKVGEEDSEGDSDSGSGWSVVEDVNEKEEEEEERI